MARKRTAPRGSTLHNMEDKVFNNLITRYTKLRDWSMVTSLFRDYGRILEDREAPAS